MKESVDVMANEVNLPELTFRGMILGMILTGIFTASNVYLGLKVGLTFSSSIPAAVISMAVLRMFAKSNILENNMVQTQVSAAGTLSAVIFIIPGLLMSGYWTEFPLWQTFMICLCGGVLGVLFSIPLRRAMVVHSDLAYPEGKAAAEILKAGSASHNNDNAAEQSDSGLKEIGLGGIIAGGVSLCTSGFRLLAGDVQWAFSIGKAVFNLTAGLSLALFGAGYLIGLAGGIAMLVGMILAWGVFTPYFTTIIPPKEGMDLVSFASSVWSSKVRFIGTGTIGIAALWTFLTLLKPVISGIKELIANASRSASEKSTHRMDTDLSLKAMSVVFGLVLIGLFITIYSFVAAAGFSSGTTIGFTILGTIVVLIISFLVAAACGYMAGLVGSSSSPISGIGLLGIIITSIIILIAGSSEGIFADPNGKRFAIAFAIFITSIILATATISNDNLQDLKTGLLVGATPWKQQVALIIGCVFGACAIAPVLNLLYQAYGFTGAFPRPGMDPSQAMAAPQANLMTTIAQGIFNNNVDWTLIEVGIGIGIAAIIINSLLHRTNPSWSLPPLAVGMGIYLPPSADEPLVVGAIVAYFVHKYLKNRAQHRDLAAAKDYIEQHERRGVLFASGMIVGESIIGVIVAGIIVVSVTSGGSDNPLALVGKSFSSTASWLGILVCIAAMIYFVRRTIADRLNNK
ncbi:OPT family oligopeptide transporter [Pectinatus frisingensis]|jgi:putative OPT family oligopeptide transporter|uniref:OPT family oligopeptide transporter n=1 Tax=Pectinatus frisingensis TaxID=865 RepID=UPI0018C4ABEE|nr:oligopeptide transporter, OPT family [Pectinatus frisingensis]